jgi:hypothetical protein
VKKILAGLAITIGLLLGAASPAAAGPAVSQADCSGSDQQNGPRISVRVYYAPYAGSCYVSEVRVWLSGETNYGNQYQYGPYGFSSESEQRWWAQGDYYVTYPHVIAWSGNLWCGRFIEEGAYVIDDQCVTV